MPHPRPRLPPPPPPRNISRLPPRPAYFIFSSHPLEGLSLVLPALPSAVGGVPTTMSFPPTSPLHPHLSDCRRECAARDVIGLFPPSSPSAPSALLPPPAPPVVPPPFHIFVNELDESRAEKTGLVSKKLVLCRRLNRALRSILGGIRVRGTPLLLLLLPAPGAAAAAPSPSLSADTAPPLLPPPVLLLSPSPPLLSEGPPPASRAAAEEAALGARFLTFRELRMRRSM